jgi:uncharacterized protein
MKRLPSRYRRLDGALADLPLEEPMLLSELDGFLTGILCSPAAVDRAEWMTVIWGADGDVPPFDDPLDVQWFADAVEARRGEIARDLARGRLQPLFDVDERNGDTLWESWLHGFADAMALRADEWTVLADHPDAQVAEAMARLSLLLAVADEESDLDSVEINALQDDAPDDLMDCVQRIYAARAIHLSLPSVVMQPKPGRNDPCHCGSGAKFKRCCG